jgi:hypothetical protein
VGISRHLSPPFFNACHIANSKQPVSLVQSISGLTGIYLLLLLTRKRGSVKIHFNVIPQEMLNNSDSWGADASVFEIFEILIDRKYW